MKLPGFTAEASLYRKSDHNYLKAVLISPAEKQAIIPQDNWKSSIYQTSCLDWSCWIDPISFEINCQWVWVC